MVGEDGKVTFTEAEQKEVDRIVGERLAREGVQDKDEIVNLLHEFDYDGTPAEIKETLKAQAETYKQSKAERAKQAEIEALQSQAEQSGTSPELLAEIKALKSELTDLKAERQAEKTKSEARKQADEAAKKSYDEAAQVYGEDTLVRLSKDEDFLDYVAGKVNTPVKTLVERFMKIKGKALDEGYAKAASKAARSTGSGGGKEGAGTYGLTEHQQQLATENGIPFKDYANALGMVQKR